MGAVSPLDSLPPTETVELENGLSLTPRVRLTLTVHPSVPSAATKPVDEWKLRRALLDFLKSSLSLAVPEEDLVVKRFRDLKKRKRDDAVARGTLLVRDLGFLREREGTELIEWRTGAVEKMDGIELNLEGVEYKLTVEVPECDDFDGMRKSWEELRAFDTRGIPRGGGGAGRQQEVDTIVVRGLPSRWFAEPRVSSKPSMLVTHTIFSALGRIRNLDITDDDGDQAEDADEGSNLTSGLHCKVVVQFESHRDFHNALKVLCGRSLEKKGTRLKADYEVSWARDVYFKNTRVRAQQNSSRPIPPARGISRSEALKHEQSTAADETRRKRFRARLLTFSHLIICSLQSPCIKMSTIINLKSSIPILKCRNRPNPDMPRNFLPLVTQRKKVQFCIALVDLATNSL